MGRAQLPIKAGGFQCVFIFAAPDGRCDEIGLAIDFIGKGLQGAATGGLVTGIFVRRRQIVAGAHPVDEAHKVFAAVQAVLLNPSRFGKAAGTVGYLKALLAVFDALSGAGGCIRR